ncbi:MAG TPA: hypothetical protein VLE73_02600 [Candidatus Saccharimonadales bacterium]|nr:hypothetical protein [Candidatus Saccharimonadales bacterium]
MSEETPHMPGFEVYRAMPGIDEKMVEAFQKAAGPEGREVQWVQPNTHRYTLVSAQEIDWALRAAGGRWSDENVTALGDAVLRTLPGTADYDLRVSRNQFWNLKPGLTSSLSHYSLGVAAANPDLVAERTHVLTTVEHYAGLPPSYLDWLGNKIMGVIAYAQNPNALRAVQQAIKKEVPTWLNVGPANVDNVAFIGSSIIADQQSTHAGPYRLVA